MRRMSATQRRWLITLQREGATTAHSWGVWPRTVRACEAQCWCRYVEESPSGHARYEITDAGRQALAEGMAR